jgi:transcription initiation factor TFIID subunit 5
LELLSKGMNPEAKRFLDTFKGDHIALHESDIKQLASITDAYHLKENKLASMYRENKYSLRMCNYAFELFINFLQDNKLMNLLKIVNQYLNTRVYLGNPSDESTESGNIGITGTEITIFSFRLPVSYSE